LLVSFTRVDPQNPHGSGIPTGEPLEDFDRRGLAGAVGAEESEDLTRLHLEAHVVEGTNRTE
jgi:hypothetical protein